MFCSDLDGVALVNAIGESGEPRVGFAESLAEEVSEYRIRVVNGNSVVSARPGTFYCRRHSGMESPVSTVCDSI